VKITGCGLCQTKVPCEFQIPKQIHDHRDHRGISK
jgi:L-lactate utilization protein LutB